MNKARQLRRVSCRLELSDQRSFFTSDPRHHPAHALPSSAPQPLRPCPRTEKSPNQGSRVIFFSARFGNISQFVVSLQTSVNIWHICQHLAKHGPAAKMHFSSSSAHRSNLPAERRLELRRHPAARCEALLLGLGLGAHSFVRGSFGKKIRAAEGG